MTGLRMTLSTQLVLRQLLDAPDRETYGAEVCAAVGLPSGTIHPILARLEKFGWLESRWENADPAEKWRPKRRYYRLRTDAIEHVQCALAWVQVDRSAAADEAGACGNDLMTLGGEVDVRGGDDVQFTVTGNEGDGAERTERVLAKLRTERGLTQQAVARHMNVSQARVAAIESQDLLATEVATLAKYISALGGKLHLIADFGDETQHVSHRT